VWTATMAPSVGASSCTTSGTGFGATSGSPSDSTTSSGAPLGVRGSLTGTGPGVTPTAASAAAVPITVAAPEGEDLGKKGNRRMKPHKKNKCKRRRRWAQKAGEWEYGFVHSVPPPIYPPLQAATHRARRFMPTPCCPHTQALTSEPRPRSSVGTGQRNGAVAALKRNPRASRMRGVPSVRGTWS
jgi:hypothetical protein